MQRGYSDGFLTTKMFAQHGPAMSRLEFKAQYMKDTVTLLKGMEAIGDGDESKYQEWFWKGLNDGEGLVEKVIAALTPPPLRENTIYEGQTPATDGVGLYILRWTCADYLVLSTSYWLLHPP